jgi:hypothetical protein
MITAITFISRRSEMRLIRALRTATALALLGGGLLMACSEDDETTTETDDTDTRTEVEQAQPGTRTGPEGCYIQAEMRCDCDLDEAGCTEDVGVWTPGCSSCS